jgi:ribonuclease G
MTWLVERGIGEERALRYENGRVVAARVRWPGQLEAGQVEDAVLIHRPKGSTRGRARFASGEEALVSRLPASASKGGPLRLEVTRAAIRERARTKLAQARPCDQSPRPAPALAETLPDPREVRRFPEGAWEELWAEARDATVPFAGGSLHLAPTAAMTLVDIDGTFEPKTLALAAVRPLAAAIQRLGIGGSIGIDFPTLPARADRQAVDAALSESLAGWDHERTAMNGFGFVQLVAESSGPSLLHRLAFDRAGAAARYLLRQAEGLEGAGSILLTAHPAVLAAIGREWLDELARRTGRVVRTVADPAVALGGGHAQIAAT